MSEEVKDQQQEGGKVRKKYDEALSNLTRVLGGQSLYAPIKLASTEVQTAVMELAKEEKEKATKAFKEKAIALIQKKREHDRHVAQLKKDFLKKEEESMKKFTEEAGALFKELENIQNIEKDYYDVLLSAKTGTSSASETATSAEEKE